MDERLQRLQALIGAQAHAFNRASEGLIMPVLIERNGKKPGQRLGKSPWLQSVLVESDLPIGSMIDVEIVSGGPNSLQGIVARRAAA